MIVKGHNITISRKSSATLRARRDRVIFVKSSEPCNFDRYLYWRHKFIDHFFANVGTYSRRSRIQYGSGCAVASPYQPLHAVIIATVLFFNSLLISDCPTSLLSEEINLLRQGFYLLRLYFRESLHIIYFVSFKCKWSQLRHWPFASLLSAEIAVKLNILNFSYHKNIQSTINSLH